MRKDELALAWVHSDTGSMRCTTPEPVKEIPVKTRWPHIHNDPRLVAHLRDIISRLETPMMPNTKAAVLACLDELHRRISPPESASVPRSQTSGGMEGERKV